jgi:hypothetical protein
MTQETAFDQKGDLIKKVKRVAGRNGIGDHVIKEWHLENRSVEYLTQKLEDLGRGAAVASTRRRDRKAWRRAPAEVRNTW